MQFESDSWFDTNGGFGLCSQPISCPSNITNFSSASSASESFTPPSRQSNSRDVGDLYFNGPCSTVSHRSDLAPPSSAMGESVSGRVKSEHMPFSDALPSTPMKREHLNLDYKHMLDMNVAYHGSMDSLTPPNSFGMYEYSPDASIGAISFMMTPTQGLAGPEAVETVSPWPCTNNSPIPSFPHEQLPNDFQSFDLDQHSQSPLGYSLHDSNSSNRMRAQRKKMNHEIQRNTTELQHAHVRSSRKRSMKPDPAQVDVVRRAMCKCDYPGCHKKFRRNEHLKRHKQIFHGEGPNRFSCEFCGKDQFNRQDNLNNHRKLHARPRSHNRGVVFIPAAVPVIEQEGRSRKRRAPPKSKRWKPEY